MLGASPIHAQVASTTHVAFQAKNPLVYKFSIYWAAPAEQYNLQHAKPAVQFNTCLYRRIPLEHAQKCLYDIRLAHASIHHDIQVKMTALVTPIAHP